MDEWKVAADLLDDKGFPEQADAMRDPCVEWVGQWITIYGVNFNFVGILKRITDRDIVLTEVHQIRDVDELVTLDCKFFADEQCFTRSLNGNFGPTRWAKPTTPTPDPE